jgi:hypothetical protein
MPEQQDPPSAIVEQVITIIDERIQKAMPENRVFTRAIQKYAAGGIGRVLAEAIKVGQEAATGPSVSKQKVSWNLDFRTSPVPMPMWGAPWSIPDTGGQTPYTGVMYAPNRLDLVESLAKEYEWLMKADPASFTRLVAKQLHAIDPAWGLKSRPGGPISKDTLAFRRPDGQTEAIDILTGSGTGNPTPKWHNYGPVPADWHQP